MADFTPQQLIEELIGAKTPEQVDDTFQAVSKLEDQDRRMVVDTVEMFFVENFKAFAPVVKHEVDEVRGVFKELEAAGMLNEVQDGLNTGPLAKSIVEPFQTQAQLAWRIYESKGEGTDPMIQSMIKKVSALSSEDYNSVMGAINVLMALIDEVAPPDSKGPGFNPPSFNPGGPKFGF